MAEIVLKWAYRHFVMEVDEYDTLDEAVSAAVWAAEEGAEAFGAIEVICDGVSRIVGFDECLALAEPAEPSPLPREWWRVEVASPADGTWGVLDEVASEEAAVREVGRLKGQMGDRVRWVKRTRP